MARVKIFTSVKRTSLLNTRVKKFVAQSPDFALPFIFFIQRLSATLNLLSSHNAMRTSLSGNIVAEFTTLFSQLMNRSSKLERLLLEGVSSQV